MSLCCNTNCSVTGLECPDTGWKRKRKEVHHNELQVGDWVVHVWEETQENGVVQAQWEGCATKRSIDQALTVAYTHFDEGDDLRHVTGTLPLPQKI